MYSMNYSRIRTANPLALGLEMSSLALFFLLLSPAPLDSLHLLPFLNCINYSGLLINNTDLCRQEVQAWWGWGGQGGAEVQVLDKNWQQGGMETEMRCS